MTTAIAPSTRPAWVSPYADALARFHADTTEHKMTVLHDHGVYRHVRFQEPGTGMYYFDLITTPGLLTITGDMGTYSFARIHDMFNFFDITSYGINPQYWGEKLQAISRNGGYREHSSERFKEWVNGHWADRMDCYTPAQRVKIRAAIDRMLNCDDWEYDLEHVEGAMDALDGFDEVEGFKYTETWDIGGFEDYTSHYLWACHAIQWGIGQYKAAAAAFRAPYTSKQWAA